MTPENTASGEVDLIPALDDSPTQRGTYRDLPARTVRSGPLPCSDVTRYPCGRVVCPALSSRCSP